MQARRAVQCRSARVSEAVSPAKSARVAIGLIVVKSVAKSLLILIKSGDICRSVRFILVRMMDQALARFWRATSHDRTRELILPIHAFLSRHSFSTRRSLVRRLVSVGGSLIRMKGQARGKAGTEIRFNVPTSHTANGATGVSDMAGKAARAAVERCGNQPRYNHH